MRDFSERQSQLFFADRARFCSSTSRPSLQPLIDDDVADAAAALAATFETASRGVIYEHRPASLPAERLAAALKPMLAEAGQARRLGVRARRGGRAAPRRADGRAEQRAGEPGNRRAFLDLLGRVLAGADEPPQAGDDAGRRPRRSALDTCPDAAGILDGFASG